jgi:predicted O-methyltransferase YrrM
MSLRQARTMTEFIAGHKLRDIFELGFCHGVSTCSIAGTLKENGGRSVVAIDRENICSLTPNINELLRKCGLADIVTV